MAESFEDSLEPNKGLTEEPISDESIIKEIEAENEKEYYQELKKKNKDFLVKVDLLQRERIAQHIVSRFQEAKPKHDELCDKIQEWDEVHRMTRKEVPGSDGNLPNYRTPISTVALEVVHSSVMNVFFTPKDIGRVLPTEEGDSHKVSKLATFLNWSSKNEMNIFDQCDRLFHNSAKVGECPYIVHWVKEYGTDIVREPIMNPADPTQPLIDPDTQQPIFQEREEQKLLYNGPKLEVFSRKDYIQPDSALLDKRPEWEMRKVRMTYDDYLREELQGKMYKGSIKEIKDWGHSDSSDSNKEDYEGDTIPVGAWEKEFVEFYGRMRISVVKEDAEDETEDKQELEDEFIGIVNIDDGVLCSLRRNKFPLKERPIGMDYFIPDDEGRRSGLGVMEFMENIQKAYDALFNQYIYGTTQSNNPIGFYTPMGNQRDEKIKLQNGYMYPTADPRSINFLKLPPPDGSIHVVLELVNQWAQLLFGISDFSAGMESTIDPDAPAKKVQVIVAQGNVRMNMIVKRKNKTLQDIFRRWFLLYKENMPPNKFMRIVGDSKDNPWKFEAITLADFALKSIPDFELTGNILNVNKTLEANKALAVYNVFITNPFFNPQTRQGLLALNQLTKWLADRLDETGISRFIPDVPGEMVHTPEEENARFLQGDSGDPARGEDHVNHLRVHRAMLSDQTVPDEIKQKLLIPHIQETVRMMQEEVTEQIVLQQSGINPEQFKGGNGDAITGGNGERPSPTTNRVFPEQPAGVG